MAWIFSLSAEFGPNRADADNFSEYFRHVSLVLSDGQQFSCKASVNQESGGESQNWWCMISPTKADGEYLNVYEEEQLLTELSNLLYKHLQSSPPFRYALIGVEVDDFRTYDELVSDDLIKDEPSEFSGLVVSSDIWSRLGSPNGFVSFRPDYFWVPFRPPARWI